MNGKSERYSSTIPPLLSYSLCFSFEWLFGRWSFYYWNIWSPSSYKAAAAAAAAELLQLANRPRPFSLLKKKNHFINIPGRAGAGCGGLQCCHLAAGAGNRQRISSENRSIRRDISNISSFSATEEEEEEGEEREEEGGPLKTPCGALETWTWNNQRFLLGAGIHPYSSILGGFISC